MVLAEHSKARYKQASTKEMRSPAVVLDSLEPLILEPVRFPQLFGNRRQYLNALVIRHLRCDPCRDETSVGVDLEELLTAGQAVRYQPVLVSVRVVEVCG